MRRAAAVRAVFERHAAELRSRASGAPPGSAERAALEAEAADVEAAAADWPRIMKDEIIMSGPTAAGGCCAPRPKNRVSYTPAQKEQAAGERQALLSRHAESAFQGVREEAHKRGDFLKDGIFLIPFAYVASKVQCNAPAYQLCFTSMPPTYTCAFGPDGACVATPA